VADGHNPAAAVATAANNQAEKELLLKFGKSFVLAVPRSFISYF